MSNRGITLSEVQMLDSMFSSIPSSGISGHVATAPPAGAHPIVNIFVDPNALELYVQFDDAADPSATFTSTPPQGSFPITNMYYNPTDGMNYIQYDDAL